MSFVDPLQFSPLAFLGLGFQELLLIAFVALLVFGGNLPDVMHQLGRTYGKFRQSLNELSRPVREELRQVRDIQAPGRTPTSYDSGPPVDEEDHEPLDHPKIQTSPGDELPDCIARTPNSDQADSVEPEDGHLAGEASAESPLRRATERKSSAAAEIDEPPPV